MNFFRKNGSSIILLICLTALSFTLYLYMWQLLVPSILWSMFIGFIHNRILSTGKVYSYRSIYFIILAVSFIAGFRLTSVEVTQTPYCHIGIAGNLIHTLYNQILAITNSSWGRFGALSAGLLWLAVILINGGGFCSYACFFGGIDEGFSGILKKPLIRLPQTKRFREFQIASLLFFAFISFTSVEAVFCTWLCPLKVTNHILNPEAPAWLIQNILYISTGAVFLVGLPLLTKKRTFCSIICPFGALPPLLYRINPYKMSVDDTKCTGCKKCLAACPSFAIEEAGDKVKINRYCTLCGKCLETCSGGAIKTTLFHKRESFLMATVSLAIGGGISLFIFPAAVMNLVEWTIKLAGWKF